MTDDSLLQTVCEAAGLTWSECQAAISDPEIARRVEADTSRLVALGQWGVPVFIFNGEPVWGQDRIEDMQVRLAEAGLAKG